MWVVKKRLQLVVFRIISICNNFKYNSMIIKKHKKTPQLYTRHLIYQMSLSNELYSDRSHLLITKIGI